MGDMHGIPGMPALPRLRPFPTGVHDADGFGSAEPVELSPHLGQYFGVEKGLLVVRAPHDERLKLHIMRQQKRIELPIEVPDLAEQPRA
jgi:hypothetical protein